MRIAQILSAIGVAACLTAVVPVTAEANNTSPYTRMDKIEHRGMMRRHMMMHRHRMYHRYHRYHRHHRMM